MTTTGTTALPASATLLIRRRFVIRLRWQGRRCRGRHDRRRTDLDDPARRRRGQRLRLGGWPHEQDMDRRAPSCGCQLEPTRTGHRQTGGVGHDDGDAFTANDLLDGPLARRTSAGRAAADATAPLPSDVVRHIDEDRVIKKRRHRAPVRGNGATIPPRTDTLPCRMAAGNAGAGLIRSVGNRVAFRAALGLAVRLASRFTRSPRAGC